MNVRNNKNMCVNKKEMNNREREHIEKKIHAKVIMIDLNC